MTSSNSAKQVSNFLKKINLTQYEKVLFNEGFDSMDAIITLTKEDLVEFGFKKGHIRSLLTNIKKYKKNNESSNDFSPPSKLSSSDDTSIPTLGRKVTFSNLPPNSKNNNDENHLSPNVDSQNRNNSMSMYDSHLSNVSLAETVRINQTLDINDPTLSVSGDKLRDIKYSGSLSVGPPLPDINNDLNALLDVLYNADIRYEHWDDYHEAILSNSNSWDYRITENILKKELNNKNKKYHYVIYGMLGILYIQLNKINNAKESFNKSLEINNNYIQVLHDYGYLYQSLGGINNFNMAINYYKKALSINNKYAYCFQHYGNILEDLRKLNEAKEMYYKAIEIRTDIAAFRLDLANTLDDLKEYDLAEKHYKKAISLDNKSGVYHWNYAIFLEHQKRFNEAEIEYLLSIELNPYSTDAHLNLAQMLENLPLPQYDNALSHYTQVIELSINNNIPIPYHPLLRCAILNEYFNQSQQSEQYYLKLLELFPNIADVYINYARLLYNENRVYDCNSVYQRGLQIINDNKQNNDLKDSYINFLERMNRDKKEQEQTLNTLNDINDLNDLNDGTKSPQYLTTPKHSSQVSNYSSITGLSATSSNTRDYESFVRNTILSAGMDESQYDKSYSLYSIHNIDNVNENEYQLKVRKSKNNSININITSTTSKKTKKSNKKSIKFKNSNNSSSTNSNEKNKNRLTVKNNNKDKRRSSSKRSSKLISDNDKRISTKSTKSHRSSSKSSKSNKSHSKRKSKSNKSNKTNNNNEQNNKGWWFW